MESTSPIQKGSPKDYPHLNRIPLYHRSGDKPLDPATPNRMLTFSFVVCLSVFVLFCLVVVVVFGGEGLDRKDPPQLWENPVRSSKRQLHLSSWPLASGESPVGRFHRCPARFKPPHRDLLDK